MKLNKILMPALSIASVGAIVTPIVTSCNKTVGISLTKFEDVWTSGENKIKFKAGQTVRYTGPDFALPSEKNKYLIIDTFNQEGTVWEVKTMSVNGKQLSVESSEVTYETVTWTVYYCDLTPAQIRPGAPLTVDVTYKDAGTDCGTIINIDNTL